MERMFAGSVWRGGNADGTPHVSRSSVFWDVGCIQNKQERFFFQAFLGDPPAAEVCSPVTFE